MANTFPDGPSDTTLEETPGRVLTFLRGLTKNPTLYALMSAGGYTAADHQEGWKLLLTASGYVADAPVAPTTSPADAAMATIDAWDEDGFAQIRGALERLYPAQADFVFAGGLAASRGPASVVGVKLLLDRLDVLESGKGRTKAEHKVDAAALATLDQRGVTKAERARLRALVDAAQDPGDAPAPPTDTSAAEAAHRADLGALYAWYKDWSATARARIKKKAWLITLGLANRKSPTKPPAPTPPTT